MWLLVGAVQGQNSPLQWDEEAVTSRLSTRNPTVQPKLGLIWFWKELKGRQVVGDRQIQSIWTQCVGKSIDPGSPISGSFRVCCPILGGENMMWKDLTTWSPSIVAATRFPSILPPTQRTHTTDIQKGWVDSDNSVKPPSYTWNK